MSTSHICTHFTQNTWKKDLCSNCFKSKDEHKLTPSHMTNSVKHNAITTTNNNRNNSVSTKYNYTTTCKGRPKSIMRRGNSKNRSSKVSFPKHISEIIGYGGERSENSDDDNDFMNLTNDEDNDIILSSDDDECIELRRLTRANTDFNMHNGNFLGDPKENIKKTFAALKLGAPQVDNDGNKRTLQIHVRPFGSNTELKEVSATVSAKNKLELGTTILKSSTTEQNSNNSSQKLSSTTSLSTVAPLLSKRDDNGALSSSASSSSSSLNTKYASSVTSSSPLSDNDGKKSPPIKSALEKSLLDEISETLEKKQNQLQDCQNSTSKMGESSNTSPRLNMAQRKIKFEITSLAETMENRTFRDIKRSIVRTTPIATDQTRPKVNVFNKPLDAEKSSSENENGILGYYDFIESQISYENIPDGEHTTKANISTPISKSKVKKEAPSSIYTTSQYLTDVLLSSKTRAASYNLHEGNFMTSKIMSDGLIVTKCASDDALDSTTSSFDGSSDEEASYNMIRSESDSGIGINLSHDCKASSMLDESKKGSEKVPAESSKDNKKMLCSKNVNNSNIKSDYEIIEVVDYKTNEMIKEDDITEKSRELHGEPDGSADPDGSLERTPKDDSQKPPALPKTLPPTKVIDARPSFLHGMQQPPASTLLKKPDLPAKPCITKKPERQQQQIISNQLLKPNDDLNSTADSLRDDLKDKLKKGKAPNPPPPVTSDQDNKMEFPVGNTAQKRVETTVKRKDLSTKLEEISKKERNIDTAEYSNHKYIRSIGKNNFISSNCGTVSKAMAAQVLKDKDKTEHNNINAKFRSLNAFATQRNNAIRNLELQNIEPTPPRLELKSKNAKALSMSEECLNEMSTTSGSLGNAMSITNLSANFIAGEKKSSTKNKGKFSIKKFLRMGTNKTSDNLHNSKHNKETIYSEICTGEESNISGKPRLVIIHPIDINPAAVEVVKDITKTNDTVVAQTVAVCMSPKPPVPPLRTIDNQKAQEINKPIRPPPPKSAELHRKQKIPSSISSPTLNFTTKTEGSVTNINHISEIRCDIAKNKPDNVYANLGEIRSSIAPRKPERTASMREREAQLELARYRHIEGTGKDNCDSISPCSPANNGNTLNLIQKTNIINNSCRNSPYSEIKINNNKLSNGNSNYRQSDSLERKKNEPKISLSNKLEIFGNDVAYSMEQNKDNEKNIDSNNRNTNLKDSVRKITSTIDNYLKDKRDYENLYECVKNTTSPTSCRARDVRFNQQQINKRNNISTDIISLSSYTRSEYGPLRTSAINNYSVNMPHHTSTSYCGSEIGDFDIYSPYSYYGSEAGGDVTTDINEIVWGVPVSGKNRTKAVNRLRLRKGRSVVHKSIEDNYSAVVNANHEALAQVLEQLQQIPVVPFVLRPLANAINLRFEDFTILEGGRAFVVGKKAFHSAMWNGTPVTLALSADCNQLAGVGGELNQLSGGISGALNPITEFCDLVPSYHLPLMPSTEISLLQATISVLPRLQLDTLQSIGALLREKYNVLNKSNYNLRGSISNLMLLKENNVNALRNGTSVQNLATLNEETSDIAHEETDCADFNGNPINASTGITAFDDVMTREVAFIMLQLINGMKNLQMKGIEDMPLSLSNVVLSKEVDNKDAQARLCVLQANCNNEEEEYMATLCKCAYTALNELLPITKITDVVSDILKQGRSESLSKSKSVLEFILWGPSDVTLAGTTKERELALQRWLDLERATVLHGLVRTRVELTVYDECHLMFLVRSTAKIMNEAAKLLELHSTATITSSTVTE